jgi:hypothetical protein
MRPMNALSIDLTVALVALCAGMALVALFRLVDSHSARAAAEKTRRLLGERKQGHEGGEDPVAEKT